MSNSFSKSHEDFVTAIETYTRKGTLYMPFLVTILKINIFFCQSKLIHSNKYD